jgi:phosphoenolpyruvate synthase/pyruvate phosphate dikinase
MLGLRGCRLGIVHPEISEMQVPLKKLCIENYVHLLGSHEMGSCLRDGLLRAVLMQVRAIIEAALNVKAKGIVVLPEIMVPLVGTVEELVHQAALIRRVALSVFEEQGDTVHVSIGTMIEVPRAALLAGDIAKARPLSARTPPHPAHPLHPPPPISHASTPSLPRVATSLPAGA